MTFSVAQRPTRLDRDRQVASQIYDWLREGIVSLEFAPSATLSRTDLMQRFGVSQTPIRDALLRLANEDLVEIFPQHLTTVSPIDLPGAVQAHFLRLSIELEVVRVLALAPERHFLADLHMAVERQESLARQSDLNAFMDNDQVFHRVMCEAAGVPALWSLIRARSGHIDRLRRLDLPAGGKIEEILSSHRAILDAVAAGDAGAAEKQLRYHLSGTLSHIDRIRADHPNFIRD